ncbi:MAG TPA: hypothetical protein VFJ58_00160 [Armatimonadota bacterium]|nr:hypothetical protein [Armatimonadota bacterium]
MIEGRGSAGSLTRSFQLVEGFGWKAFRIILGVVCLCLVVTAVVGGVLGALFSPLVGTHTGSAFGYSGGRGFAAFAVNVVIQTLVAITSIPIWLLPIVVFYYDLRVRSEAFDAQMLAELPCYGRQEAGSESRAAA